MKTITVDLQAKLVTFFKRALVYTKHGPGGSGEAGPCDSYCIKCEAEKLLKEIG